jgi:hypothetical protein
MLDAILRLNADAAAQGDYEVAYHLLMAALHVADHTHDSAALERIAKVAREQGAQVEALQPPHHLARAQAQLRGQTSLFDSLGTHIEAVRLRMQSEEQRKRGPRASA